MNPEMVNGKQYAHVEHRLVRVHHVFSGPGGNFKDNPGGGMSQEQFDKMLRKSLTRDGRQR